MDQLAWEINPVVRGGMQCYGAFNRFDLYPVLQPINAYLMRWLRGKYKRLRPIKKAKAAWQRVTSQHPCSSPTEHGPPRAGGQGDKSPVTRDCHAGIRGSRITLPPRATRHCFSDDDFRHVTPLQ